MKLKLSEWASVAEIISGIAIVVTILFLALGLRENTAATRVSVYSSLIEGLNELARDVYRDPELFRIWRAYLDKDPSRLDEEEWARVREVLLIMFRTYDTAFMGREYEIVGDSEWRRLESGICVNFDRAYAWNYRVGENPYLTEEFRAYMLATCESSDL